MTIIKNFIKNILSEYPKLHNFIWSMRRRPLTEFYDIGFHGDKYLIDFISTILESTKQFIETGTSVASTLRFVADKFPDLDIFGCEPDRNAFDFAVNKIKPYKNVVLRKETSPGFILKLTDNNPSILNKDTVFWLDSHANGFRWPLKEEIKLITDRFQKGYIFIDDFLVPDSPQFGFDQYDGQICSFEYIEGGLNAFKNYRIFYPSYTDTTSTFCKLRGWVMIEFGHESIPVSFPEDKIKQIFYKFNIQ